MKMCKDYKPKSRKKQKPQYVFANILPNNGMDGATKMCIKRCTRTFAILLVVALLTAVYLFFNPASVEKDGHIKLTYEQLLRYLEEEPSDIYSVVYQSNIPSIVQNDIDKIVAYDDGTDIIYYSKNNASFIKITTDASSNTGIKMEISEGVHEYNYDEVYENIAMYRNGKNIVVYGSTFIDTRFIRRFELNTETGETPYELLEEEYIDLYGAKNLEYDQVKAWNSQMTVVKNGNDFMFYRLGEQIGETITFPGGDIVEMSYYHILDSNKDMYYMYYCALVDNPWIKFVKVDEDVDYVDAEYGGELVTLEEEEHRRVQYPTYYKNGKKYAGIASLETERRYGQNYGDDWRIEPLDSIDFNVSVVEISPDKADYVILKSEYNHHSEFDWEIRYNYEVNGFVVYEEKRVNGLDAYISTLLSEDEIERFDGRKLELDELDDAIKELRELYKKYE